MISQYEQDYKSLVNRVISTGEERPSRVGPTLSVFGAALKIRELRKGLFPILTARKMHLKPILGELAAFLCGVKDLATFKDFGCNYWDDNAAAWVGNLGLTPDKFMVGRIYGVQWRDWNTQLDQVEALIRGLKEDPYSRRHILTTWNPSELKSMCLPPCHLLAQFYVTNNFHLDCIVTMRSVDLCLGLPSDVVMYAALLILVAQQVGLMPGDLTFMLGDTHVYLNHVDSWIDQDAAPLQELPAWRIAEHATVDNFHPDMFTLPNYNHGPKIKYELNT